MTLRIGVLGAARIAPSALLKPAAGVDGVEVTAIAARDQDRAARMAGKFHIPKAYGSYAERGRLSVPLFLAPQFGRLKLTADGVTLRERIGGDSTYVYQLRAFLAATRGEDTNLTPPSDSIRTMRVIDAAYRAAGLPVRGVA